LKSDAFGCVCVFFTFSLSLILNIVSVLVCLKLFFVVLSYAKEFF
jgi:hypothetical protein